MRSWIVWGLLAVPFLAIPIVNVASGSTWTNSWVSPGALFLGAALIVLAIYKGGVSRVIRKELNDLRSEWPEARVIPIAAQAGGDNRFEGQLLVVDRSGLLLRKGHLQRMFEWPSVSRPEFRTDGGRGGPAIVLDIAPWGMLLFTPLDEANPAKPMTANAANQLFEEICAWIYEGK